MVIVITTYFVNQTNTIHSVNTERVYDVL